MEKVTVLDRSKGECWTREESYKVSTGLGCHVERWARIPHRLVVHVVGATKEDFAKALGDESFVASEVASRDMWKEEVQHA